MATNSDYQKYRQNKIESGLVFQDFVVDTCFSLLGLPILQYASKLYQYRVGESRTGQEIKHDELFATTGNLFIEVAEKAEPRAGDYVPSGIFRGDNSWLYLIGDYDMLFVFGKSTLQLLTQSTRYPIIENRTKTSRGFLLAQGQAERLAAKVLTPKAKHAVTQAIHDHEAIGRELHRLITSRNDGLQLELFGGGKP